MGVIFAVILMILSSFAAGDPTSGQDYGLCSQACIMNQCCSSQQGQTANGMSHRHVRPRVRTQAGTQGPSGVVNKTEINEIITGIFSEYAASMEESFSKWKNLTELAMDEMKRNLINKEKELQELKDQLDKVKAESDMRRVKASIERTSVSCRINFNGICYWTHVQVEQNVNFARAEEICLNKTSTPSHFPNEEVYNNVVDDLRSKILSGISPVWFWTGVAFNPNTGNVIHPSGDTYVKWYPGYPRIGSSYKTWTHVLLRVESDRGSIHQGMINYPPQSTFHGVVCQNVE